MNKKERDAMKTQKRRRLLIIGIDGFDWNLYTYLCSKNLIPNIERFIEKSRKGDLISAFPYTTGPAWVSFATGKNAGNHGCHNFILVRNDLDEIYPMTGEDVLSLSFYQILEDNFHKHITIVNLPGSEPSKIQGEIIYSFLAPEGRLYGPLDLLYEIPELEDYRVAPDYFLEAMGRREEFLQQLRKIENDRFEIAQKLFKRNWDLFFAMFSLSDWVNHEKYARLLDDQESKNSIIVKSYRDLDNYFQWFLDNKKRNVDVALISDHGFQVLNSIFYLNKWLIDKGYLKTKINWRLKSQGLANINFVLKGESVNWLSGWLKRTALIASKLPILFVFLGILIRFVDRFIPLESIGLPKPFFNLGLTLDLKNSQAYSVPGQVGGIYINDKKRFNNGCVAKKEYKKIRNQLIRDLKKIKSPDNGRVFPSVWKKEELYGKNVLEHVPDILLDEALYVDRAVYAKKLFRDGKTNWHSETGIIAIKGPNFKKTKKRIQGYLIDLCPTIVDYFGGEPKKYNFDGKKIDL